jgi:hypothetical protein
LFPDREQILSSLERLQADVHAGVRPPEALEQTLQEATADPALRVGYRLPGETEYVDQHGRRCGLSLSKSPHRQDQGAIWVSTWLVIVLR